MKILVVDDTFTNVKQIEAVARKLEQLGEADGGRLPDEPTLAPAETLPAELWPAATIGSPAAAAMGFGSTQVSG